MPTYIHILDRVTLVDPIPIVNAIHIVMEPIGMVNPIYIVDPMPMVDPIYIVDPMPMADPIYIVGPLCPFSMIFANAFTGGS